jgi:hypothetical protein
MANDSTEITTGKKMATSIQSKSVFHIPSKARDPYNLQGFPGSGDFNGKRFDRDNDRQENGYLDTI